MLCLLTTITYFLFKQLLKYSHGLQQFIFLVFQLLLKTGAEGKQTVFLFADNQIKDESFMEDISMILNTGDVPNLYAADEKAEIIEKMQTVARNEVRRIYCSFPFVQGNINPASLKNH